MLRDTLEQGNNKSTRQKTCRATQTDVTSSSPLKQWFTHVRDKTCEGTLRVSRPRGTTQAPSLRTKLGPISMTFKTSSSLQHHFVVSHLTLGIWNSLDRYSGLTVWSSRETKRKTGQNAPDSETCSPIHRNPGQTRQTAKQPLRTRFCNLQSDTSRFWANTCNNVTAHQILQLAVRFIALQGKHVSEQREVTVYKILQLTVRFIEILGNTCFNRKRERSENSKVCKTSIWCFPRHRAVKFHDPSHWLRTSLS